jgi:hypothetical protein
VHRLSNLRAIKGACLLAVRGRATLRAGHLSFNRVMPREMTRRNVVAAVVAVDREKKDPVKFRSRTQSPVAELRIAVLRKNTKMTKTLPKAYPARLKVTMNLPNRLPLEHQSREHRLIVRGEIAREAVVVDVVAVVVARIGPRSSRLPLLVQKASPLLATTSKTKKVPELRVGLSLPLKHEGARPRLPWKRTSS